MESRNALRIGCTGDARTAPRGTTLVELTVATAIMATVFAAMMPLFVGIRNSADARWASLEMVQNARVLNEQLCRYLTQARRVIAVSASTDDGGYIEFETQGGIVYRCAVGTRGYIEFGPVGKLHNLAGPVEYLRFACYSDADFDRPLQTPADVRLVSWEVGLKSTGSLTQGKSVAGACCLRVHPSTTDSGASIGYSR
jgi:type II secretory pathway pseudopilin PulG